MAQPAQEIEVFEALPQLSLRGASLFTECAKGAVSASGRFAVALSGGSTPQRLYTALASRPEFRDPLPWDRTHFFWGDERYVPPDHPDSNFRMVNQALLSKLKLPRGNVHRIRSELSDAAAAAQAYEEELRQFFDLPSDQVPRFDLMLLGLGPDGHTASLFPGTEAIHERRRLVVAHLIPRLGSVRITLTPPVLQNAWRALVLVSGAEKAKVVAEVLEGPLDLDRWPAQLLRAARGSVTWLLDRAAAAQLRRLRS
jgi:6-phosphogluconolactonase